MPPPQRLAVQTRKLIGQIKTRRDVGAGSILDMDQARLEREVLTLCAVVLGEVKE